MLVMETKKYFCRAASILVQAGLVFFFLTPNAEAESFKHSPDMESQASCKQCHKDLSSSHYDGTNPFVDEITLQSAVTAGGILKSGRVVCTSCHDLDPKEKERYLLSKEYFEYCKDSRALNPHWNDYLCLTCHSDKPLKGNPRLRENGNKNKVCNRCHASEYARADIHPVELTPSKYIHIPEYMPLQNGRLTCETCHNSLLQACRSQQGNGKKINPNFLRRSRDPSKLFCLTCHIEETYTLLNPHEKQIDAKGQIREETCLFCHASIPDVNFMGPEKVTFLVQDPNQYCNGCHPGFTKKHPSGGNHLREPSDIVKEAIRTSVERIGVKLPLINGKIVCVTCHNPHETGVIKFIAAATGTKQENKLRLTFARRTCSGCHVDK